MMTDDRTTALACVRRATEELRRTLDVLSRLTAALQNAPNLAGVRGVAGDLRAAQCREIAATQDAQRRVDELGSVRKQRAGGRAAHRPAVPTRRSGTSAGRSRATASPPHPSSSEQIARLYEDLCAAAEAAGQSATHCEEGACFRGTPDICRCGCPGCERATALLVQAQEEAAPARARPWPV